MPSQLFAKKPVQLLLDEMAGEHRLRKVLGPVQLTSLGVGCIIGAGIFVITGKAAHDCAGPALMLSFATAGLACIFAALCYAEFASMIPVAGSAYAYAYATLGEVLAWIIGWDLILEYGVASATVAHGWSKYFQDFLQVAFGIHWPSSFSTAPFELSATANHLVSTHAFFDLPAILITAIITVILVLGIRESATVNAVMVVIKLAVVLMVIIVGARYVDPANWHPFAPYGLGGLSLFGDALGQVPGAKPVGMLAGAAVIFFAYIGFDSVSTHAEEARKPQRDVPIGIIVSLLLCTVLYIAVAAVLTGMVPYNQIDKDAPVSKAFEHVGVTWAQFIVSLGALAGITSVLLVLMLSQARVLLAMARDGLLPISFFGAVHERFRTPWKSTILTGCCVALPAALLPLDLLSELVNIGTLLAFVIVCAAVLIMRKLHPDLHRPFKTPLVPFVPIMGILLCLMLMLSLPWENWLRLVIWLAIGFMIYVGYGRHHSVMAKIRAGLITVRDYQPQGGGFPVAGAPSALSAEPHLGPPHLSREISAHGVSPGGSLATDLDEPADDPQKPQDEQA